MDFAKAFDKVPHKRLIDQIKSHSINGNLVKWMKDFLSERHQRVIVNNAVRMGGRNLRHPTRQCPWTTIIYHVHKRSARTNQIIYTIADDTKLFRAIKNVKDIECIQDDITQLTEWSIKWQLPFNDKKM